MSRRFNPPGESVWLQALGYRIRYFPARVVNTIDWKIYRTRLVTGRIIHIDIPYWLSKRGK